MRVFAVDETSVQLTWRASPAAGLRLSVGGEPVHPAPSPPVPLVLTSKGDSDRYRSRPLDPRWPAGPGAVTISGLEPGRSYEVVASAEGVPAFRAATVATLRPPGGELTACFATVSDVHIGEQRFGIMGRIHDPFWQTAPYPQRALEAAYEEARLFGAELLVVKGDLTREATAAEMRDAAQLLSACPLPMITMLGNHDNHRRVNQISLLSAQGVTTTLRPQVVDVPGLRIIALNTMHPAWRYHRGHVPAEALTEIADAAADAPGAVWLGLHHPPELYPFPTVYPPGIPYREAIALLDAVARANPRTFVSAGHRHRNRLYRYRGLTISEVGSTKDYPGVWAGYRVYEGGITQSVKRISRPDVIAWTEATRRAINGQWGLWSQGRLKDRCFSLRWAQAPARDLNQI